MIILAVIGIALCSFASVNGIEIRLSACPIQGQVYQDCPPCYATCSRPFQICPSGSCTPGCGCPAGQVVDTVNKKCVSIGQCLLKCALVNCALPICASGAESIVPPGQCCPVCACRVGSRVYRAGETFNSDCNSCMCTTLGEIICTTAECEPNLSEDGNSVNSPDTVQG